MFENRFCYRCVSTRMRYLVTAALIVTGLSLPAAAQSVTIAGRVVAGDSDDPVANARVSLTGAGRDGAVHLTDADGRFAFSAASGPHLLVITKPGFARAEVAPDRARATEIRLQRGAVISGRIMDEFGDPVIHARVSAETVPSGSANTVTLASADTDDRGEYRLAGLPAGEFIVAVITMNPGASPFERTHRTSLASTSRSLERQPHESRAKCSTPAASRRRAEP
jgi:Carboxypeptidase regulatory-like domain